MAQSYTLGFPRLGSKRQLKAALEQFWAGRIGEGELLAARDEVLAEAVRSQCGAGVSRIGVGDATLFDHVLDWSVRFGLTSKRFDGTGAGGSLAQYFAQAKGAGPCAALQLLKYFDTNYHILVPEIDASVTAAGLAEDGHATYFADYVHVVRRAEAVIQEKGAAEAAAVPIVLGPVTLAHVSKIADGGLTKTGLAAALVPLYARLFRELRASGARATEVQLHEPWLATSGADGEAVLAAAQQAHAQIARDARACGFAVTVCVHHESVSEAVYRMLVGTEGVAGVALDLCRSRGAVAVLRRVGFPDPTETKRLVAGVVDGRSVWRNEEHAQALLAEVLRVVPAGRVDVGVSCSLQHVPYDVSGEELAVRGADGAVDVAASAALQGRVAFAVQKLEQLVGLARGVQAAEQQKQDQQPQWCGEDNVTVTDVDEAELRRAEPYSTRREKQVTVDSLGTSTIGSFPQTAEIRRMRQQLRTGQVSEAEYRTFIERVIEENVALQRDLGLDVFVHGEPERTDMVEYFAAQLGGVVVTRAGWVQSYGSRCVRPPIIHADIVRHGALTVAEYRHAQKVAGATPVKGMLTGPVTLLNWSFCRTDIPRSAQAVQLARAVAAEVADLQAAGCRVVQVDEAAVRERLPLKREDEESYLRWAVDAFRLSTATAAPATHIATHMCYSSFEDAATLGAIDAMDADSLLIENSRGGNAVLGALARYGYSRDVGLGVYDVHSPEIPSVDTLEARLQEIIATVHLPLSRVWINPDCGLKTRRWEEVLPALRNMVEATRRVRATGVPVQP